MSEQERQHLLDAIACEEARLKALDNEREKAAASIAALRARLEERAPVSNPSLLAPSEKVALFRNLLRGREDVYARLWTNRKTGKKGYAPACASEWVQGVCEKPRVKCGECPSQAFLPVNDQAVLDHLQGRHVMGLYPLLADETCRLLAVDFDEASWQDDVPAFAETCRMFGIEPALERSRSGNGAHVWFFFSGAVSAATARKMGCFLLTETMARHHELDMESYDRLDGVITTEFFESRAAQWRAEQADILRRIEAFGDVDLTPVETGIELLKLASGARNLYESRNRFERRELLKFYSRTAPGRTGSSRPTSSNPST